MTWVKRFKSCTDSYLDLFVNYFNALLILIRVFFQRYSRLEWLEILRFRICSQEIILQDLNDTHWEYQDMIRQFIYYIKVSMRNEDDCLKITADRY